MKRWVWALAATLLLTGCNSSDETQEELLSYLNGPYDEFLVMYEEVELIYDEYDERGANGEDEEVLEIIREDLIPQFELMQDHLTDQQFDSDEIEQLNDLLIEETSYNLQAVEVDEDAFSSVVESGEDAEQLFDERDELYMQADEVLAEFEQYLDELLDTYEIEA
ncbi:hypothetical protein JCM19037_1799 [Geomicrobium sp. JCM 19037]|uniref:hypothetical protein n=1 Tax=unclassified Geomicrobium TaxID=2628951 RepID=UPI00045F2BB8|nr:hypothetical protein [Geomicrobium sp. JCM 19037]GAK03472.1 hypothetical protein JCM19037_1799 [Geomicrobium sp. JCM 19037]